MSKYKNFNTAQRSTEHYSHVLSERGLNRRSQSIRLRHVEDYGEYFKISVQKAKQHREQYIVQYQRYLRDWLIDHP